MKIHRGPWIAVLLTLLLVLGLFLLAKRVDPDKSEKAANQKQDLVESFDFETYLGDVKAKLSAEDKQKIDGLEDSIRNAAFFNMKPQLLEKLAIRWDSLYRPDISSNFYKQRAELESTAMNWIKAGDGFMFAFLMSTDTSDQQLVHYLSLNSIESYRKATEIDPENADAKMKFASAQIDGATTAEEVMKGVQILLAIVAEDSLNEQANLVLGRNNIVNGQFDKAVARLEVVIKVNPENEEAWFHLGEANRSLGNRDRAIECFEKFKTLTNNQALSQQIDAYIESIRNGG